MKRPWPWSWLGVTCSFICNSKERTDLFDVTCNRSLPMFRLLCNYVTLSVTCGWILSLSLQLHPWLLICLTFRQIGPLVCGQDGWLLTRPWTMHMHEVYVEEGGFCAKCLPTGRLLLVLNYRAIKQANYFPNLSHEPLYKFMLGLSESRVMRRLGI